MSHERALALYRNLADTQPAERSLAILITEKRNLYEVALDDLARNDVFNDEFPFHHSAPAALVIIGMLFDPDLVDSLAPVRTRLLGLLQTFMKADLFAPKLRTLRIPRALIVEEPRPWIEETEPWTLVVPELVPLVDQELENHDPKVRLMAASLASHLYQSPRMIPEDRLRVYQKITLLAESTPTIPVQATYIYCLGHISKLPTEFLTHPSPETRLCAALSPFNKDNPEAHRVIIQTLENHADQINHWFPDRSYGPLFSGPFICTVVFTLLERVQDFKLLKKAAIRLLSVDTFLDLEWAPFLPVAFASSPGKITTQMQFDFLGAVVASDRKVWNRTGLSDSRKWLSMAGLPERHEELTEMVKAARSRMTN